MESDTVTNVVMARRSSKTNYYDEISDPLLVWGATVLWCVIVAIVTFALARRVADAATNFHRIARMLALVLCGFVLVMVSAETEREIATRFYVATNPQVSSVGIWNDFPRWPSLVVASATVALIAFNKKKRKAA
jgi:Ni/Fe-hydrogenase subunit HybB-like protein